MRFRRHFADRLLEYPRMALLDAHSFEATSSNEEQTLRLGARLGAMLPERCIITLRGDLGAGKTAFARGIGEGWGARDALRSPTYTLIQKHTRAEGENPGVLYHIDLYRAATAGDIANIGLSELLEEDAVFLIEWPERAEALLGDDVVRISIRAISDTKRQLLFSAKSDSAWRHLAAFRKAAFGV
jgi:tRNA threonylcarbamoyladenosine biosynthesis protein TsaE